ncbi:glucose-6-phosphate dehydrogenase [Williamsia sterculiae]|uniref:Glucose-6-phosphate 1-dehydrogenase n=1 Tax=Williamsia sterculiae TaxID=1344003 RepID=A0A1N7H258_9NOCA|nr:glucose-6-phosphate dehydrogenase (NADP(+)) [Williamsia sterculiae]SIS18919.1 glucose-6-phosphate 1-dehydrogenase [Williamsia sterculiae]
MADDTATIFVLFGSTGDLAKRMVLPAFFELERAGLLPTHWALVGNGRGHRSDDDFRQHVRDSLDEFDTAPSDDEWEPFAKNLYFAGGGFTADDPGDLLDVIADLTGTLGDDRQLVLYLALPPSVFVDYTEAIGAHDLAKGSRVVYEKPFGTSPKSFEELDEVVHRYFDETQVYRIDHFLGKESTQNLHVLRFANGMVSGVWNREHVEEVQIDIPETLDIDDRAEFYDSTGAFLDMIVTHLFQVAAEVAMEPPLSLSADDLQTARESVIAGFRPIDPDDVVLGQYEGYRDTDGVSDDSATDTFVAMRLWVDTDRWRGVPFVLRTGKELGVSAQQVSLIFRRPDDGPITHLPADGTVLTFDLSGDGAVDLTVTVKEPGPGLHLTLGHTEMDLDAIADGLSPYSRLILDTLHGDRSLFTRPDGLSHVWHVAAPVLDNPPTPQPYARGSMGPGAADRLPGPPGWILTGADATKG